MRCDSTPILRNAQAQEQEPELPEDAHTTQAACTQPDGVISCTLGFPKYILIMAIYAGGLHGQRLQAERCEGAAAAGAAAGRGAGAARLRDAMLVKAVKQSVHDALRAAQVACTDRNFKQNAARVQPQPELLQDMAQAQFCLVMPGNGQSSGHLADAFFSGCIPVFLGPPFHTLPFPHLVILLI